MSAAISASDEQRRTAGADSGWQETFSFEAAALRGPSAIVRWSLLRDSCWYWAYLAGVTGAVVAVRDHDLRLPRGRTLEVRGEGLWADGVCEVPLDHWSLSLEAFAVRMDDAAQGWGDERGEVIPFGFELDWEATTHALPTRGGYIQPGRLWGDLVVGREKRGIDLEAMRSHRVRTRGPASPRAELRVLDGEESRVTGSIVADASEANGVVVHRAPSGLVTGARVGSGVFTAAQPVAVPTPVMRTCVAAGSLRTNTGGELLAWLEALE